METLLELIAALETLDIPWTNGSWGKGDDDCPTVPYIALNATGGTSYGADNMTWVATMAYDVELYTSERDYALEGQLEGALDTAGIYWTKLVLHIEDESICETVYSVTVREE